MPAPPIRSSLRGDPERRMGRGDDHAAAGEMVAHQAGEQRLPGGVERRGRLVQQPDRPPHRQQAGDRQPPPLAGRQIRRRQMRGMAEPDRGEALRRCRRPRRRENPARTTGFPARSAPVSARRDGRDSGPVRAGSVRPRRPPGRSIRLPAPAGPRSAAAARSCRRRWAGHGQRLARRTPSKSRPENTSRPPRTHLMLRPESRILPRSQPFGNRWVPHQNLWVPHCCSTLVGVAALLERFYKPGT